MTYLDFTDAKAAEKDLRAARQAGKRGYIEIYNDRCYQVRIW